MAESMQRTRVWLWLTLPIAVLLAIASGGGLAVPGLYRGPLSWATQGVAQDFVDLVLVLPVLVISGLLTGRGSLRARLVWLGTLSYVVYTFVIYAFDVYFNSLYLVYIALLGCSLWALIGGLVTTDWGEIRAQFGANTLVKVVSIFLLVQAIFFYLGWLGEDVPALLAGTVPASIRDIGTPTNAVHVLDMAMLLPAIAVAAIWLWRRQTLGYGLSLVLMMNMVFQLTNIVAVMLFYIRAGLQEGIGIVPLFVVLGVIDLILLAWQLASMKSANPVTLKAATAVR